MSRFNELSLFNGDKRVVVAENGVLSLYNGMRLQNVKPVNTKFTFYCDDNSHVKWEREGVEFPFPENWSGNAQLLYRRCEVHHTMNCYPLVTIVDQNGEQMFPNISVVNGNLFTMDFGEPVSIDENSPWTCIIGFASEYGNDESISVELTNNLLESQKYAQDASAAASQAIVARSQAEAAVTAANGKLQDMQDLYDVIVNPDLIVIPSATTAYTLNDVNSVEHGRAWHYVHAPTHNSTYTLPAVTDTSISHEIILDINCSNCQNFTFTDSDGKTIDLQNDILVSPGDNYRMICVYQFGMWMVFPTEMKVAYITAGVEEEITGTRNSAITDTQLVALSSNGSTVTFTATDSPPAGITITTTGLVTGTPTQSGNFTVHVVASCKYATSVTITVTFTIS